jgi:phosphate-selective porin OprO/OprP
VWLPFGAEPDSVLHLATEIRYAGANDGQLVYKSKPEAFFAQSQAVDTGKFDASRSTIIGAELYFTRGPFSSGGEYFWNKVSSDSANDPLFHGGEVFAAYLLTGETHPYNPKTGVFGNVVPTKSFFDNGWGAWELAARGSYVDLDSETIKGGRFARISTQLNWYVSQNVRLEAVYGYGVLDRMNVTGETQFFQTRVQLAIK